LSTTRTSRPGAVTELWSYRSLIRNLARRDLAVRYKKSILGWGWSLINPAANLATYTLVFGVILKGVAPHGHNRHMHIFALYLFTGLIVWNCFNAVLTGAISALQGMGTLLNKVYFPPSCPGLASMLTSVTQAGMETTILVLALALASNAWWTLWLLPLVFIPTVAVGLGIGLALSAYNVLYRDVGYLVTIGMNLLFYGTPIVYTLDRVPHTFRWVLKINPLTELVGIARDLAYFGRLPTAIDMGYCLALSALVLVVGWNVFNIKARAVIEDL
jgi:ABC-2 type transport system permease protein